jgi:hypothetical protein
MAFKSPVLQGSARLDQAAAGPPYIKAGWPRADPEAVKRIQKALAKLIGHMPVSFPNGPANEPDGVFGDETKRYVISFQKRAFPGKPLEWDGIVGRNTLAKMDEELAKGAPAPPPPPPPAPSFVCGPDVTEQVAAAWGKIQSDFAKLTRDYKIRACNKILIPLRRPGKDEMDFPSNLEELKRQLQNFADIDGWDTLPLYQGASWWLRHPPVFDATTNGPCASPSSPDPDAKDFDPSHESDAICANTVQVGGKCWLNGTVNYGTFGIMVRLCSDFAATDWGLKFSPKARIIYSLGWAKMLIKAYKKFGANPEGALLPIAWTEATFNGGPRAVPSVPGNRPKCKCTCGCKGDVVTWDYVWEPVKPRNRATSP